VGLSGLLSSKGAPGGIGVVKNAAAMVIDGPTLVHTADKDWGARKTFFRRHEVMRANRGWVGMGNRADCNTAMMNRE
jgi:hypothetical protein